LAFSFSEDYKDDGSTAVDLEGSVLPVFNTESPILFEILPRSTNNKEDVDPSLPSDNSDSVPERSSHSSNLSSSMSTPNQPPTPNTNTVNGRVINVAATPQTFNAVSVLCFERKIVWLCLKTSVTIYMTKQQKLV
jgi:hypothetical protein